MSGKLTVRAGGEVFTRKTLDPKGEPSNFLTEAELGAKVAGLANAVIGERPAARLAETVLRLDRLEQASAVLQASAPEHMAVG
jgi:hypothetical protein